MDVVTEAKQEVRTEVWDRMQKAGAARWPGAKGRIPNFPGAEDAATLLATTTEWKRAQVVKVNPDAPQLPVRATALKEGKLLYMAVPKLADAKPFFLLDPDHIGVAPRAAASIRGASRNAATVWPADMRSIDLIVCGSVAVNRKGARVGKGGGFSDLEFALLTELGLITAETTLVTTVHPLQIVDGDLPETEHDFRVQRIVMPDQVIRCGRSRRRPPGIQWDHLDPDKISAIPVLEDLASRRRN